MNKQSVTIGYLLQNIPVEIKQRSNSVVVNFVKQVKNRWIYKVNDYIVRIKIIKIPEADRKKLTKKALSRILRVKNRDIFVSCTCNFWKYNGPDYNANKQGYGERVFSDLSSPDEKDPQKENLLCKHAYMALKEFKKKFKEVN